MTDASSALGRTSSSVEWRARAGKRSVHLGNVGAGGAKDSRAHSRAVRPATRRSDGRGGPSPTDANGHGGLYGAPDECSSKTSAAIEARDRERGARAEEWILRDEYDMTNATTATDQHTDSDADACRARRDERTRRRRDSRRTLLRAGSGTAGASRVSPLQRSHCGRAAMPAAALRRPDDEERTGGS